MMPQEFEFDVFVSYSRKDEVVVLDLAQRLRDEGVRVWLDLWQIHQSDQFLGKAESQIEYGLAHSRLLLTCISTHVTREDWATVESQSFRFRDPLNEERRMIPVRLDDAEIQISLAQFSYLDWSEKTAAAFQQLCNLCLPLAETAAAAKTMEAACNAMVRLLNNEILFSATFSVDGSLLLFGGTNGALELWQIQKNQCLQVFLGHAKRVLSVALSADGKYVLSGSTDRTVRLWRTSNGKCLRVLKGHTRDVRSVTFSPDDRYILSAGDNTLRLWEVASAKLIKTFSGHNRFVCSTFFRSDGRFALSGGGDETLRWWDLESGTCEKFLLGHTNYIKAVTISANGKLALSGSEDKTLRLWDIASGKCLHVFEGHAGDVISVCLSEDGRFAASGGRDGTMRLWDTVSGECIYIARNYTAAIVHITFSIDQTTLFSVSANSEIGSLPVAHLLLKQSLKVVPASPFNLTPSSLHPSHNDNALQYTNAKVLVVGDTFAGKTGLTERLASDTFTLCDSTDGVWSTQWPLPVPADKANPCQSEIWLWDFAGQADQRLIHQLFSACQKTPCF